MPKKEEYMLLEVQIRMNYLWCWGECDQNAYYISRKLSTINFLQVLGAKLRRSNYPKGAPQPVLQLEKVTAGASAMIGKFN